MQTEEMAFSLNPSRNHKVVMAPVHKSNINRSLRLAVVVMVANRSLNPKCKVVVVAVTVMGVIGPSFTFKKIVRPTISDIFRIAF